MMTVLFLFAVGLLMLAIFALYLALIRLRQVEEDNVALEVENERKARELARIRYDLDRLFQPYPRK